MNKREWNLHELVRAVADEARGAGKTIDLEHRGDGEIECDAEALCSVLESLLRAISAERIWMRTDARPDDPVIHLRWEGPLVSADLTAVEAALVAKMEEGEARLEIRIPRR